MDKQTGKFIARISENLPDISSELMQWWIDRPKKLQELLLGLCSSAIFPTWKTITLGTGLKTADDVRAAFERAGMKISDWANDILGKPAFTTSGVKSTVALVNVSAADLGFKDGAKLSDICSRALTFGLALCPAEVGPQLRLQYMDQPKGEWLIVAMEPITDSNGGLSVFSVGHGGRERWLNGNDGHPDYFYNGSYRFVFVCCKPA